MPCPDEFIFGNPGALIRFHEGSDVRNYKIQPINHKNRIEGVEVNGKPLALGGGEDFWYIGTMLVFPCKVTIRSANGGLATGTLTAQTVIKDPVRGKIWSTKSFPLWL